MKTHFDPSLALDESTWAANVGSIPLHKVSASSYGNLEATNHLANVDCKICLNAIAKAAK